MCPHCIAAGIVGGIVAIPTIPFAFRLLKSKLPTKANKEARQNAMKENFNSLYGNPVDKQRANPGFVSFQKAVKDDDAAL